MTAELVQTKIGILRKLRLYHYKEALKHSKARTYYEQHRAKCYSFEIAHINRKIRAEQAKWSEHMGFVQALNEFFKVGDTAERDLEREAAHV